MLAKARSAFAVEFDVVGTTEHQQQTVGSRVAVEDESQKMLLARPGIGKDDGKIIQPHLIELVRRWQRVRQRHQRIGILGQTSRTAGKEVALPDLRLHPMFGQ